jgi:hypothetical protein
MLSLMLLAACGTESSTPTESDRDTGAVDTGSDDTGTVDTGSDDTGAADTGSDDTGAADTGSDDTGAVDTGTADSGGPDSEPPGPLPPLGAPPRNYSTTPPTGADADRCSTGHWWTRGDTGSSAMRPGNECIACHTRERGPAYAVAGTVMGAYDDDYNCRGVPGAKVEIIGSDGAITTLTTNSAGNFFLARSSSRIQMPFTARVTFNDRTYTMEHETSNGDCNSCHSDVGDQDAVGRIVIP